MENLQNLVPFLQVVKCGSFTAAATRLGVTPPAISKSIARLERELGVRLLQRSTRTIHLTTEGRDFFEKINALTGGIDEAVEQVKNSVSEPRGWVRVHAAAWFARYSLMPALAEFLQRYPAVEIDLTFDDPPVNLIEGGFDLAIRYNQGAATSIVSRRLCTFPAALAASPEYLAQHGVPRHPEDLQHHQCINVRLPQGLLLEWRLRHVSALSSKHDDPEAGDYGYTPAGADGDAKDYVFTPSNTMVVSGHMDAYLHAAIADIGIIPLGMPLILPLLQTNQLKVILPEYRLVDVHTPEMEIFLQYRHSRQLAPKVRVLVDFLLEYFQRSDAMTREIKAFSA